MKVKNILSVLIVCLFLVFAACTFNEPVLPNWETLWEIPLPDISYELSEAIDNEYIFADTLQGIPILRLSIKDTVEKEGIDKAELSIKPDPDTLSTTIEQIEISSPGKESTEAISIHELLGFQVQPGDTIPIPPSTTITVTPQEVVFTSYNYVIVSTGKLILEFHNQTLLNISGGMQVDLYDDSTNQFIGTSTFPAINAYTSEFANDSLDMSGRLISRRLRLESQVPLQAGSYPVSALDTSGFTQTDVCISNMIVEEAIASIPEQSATESGAESVEDRDNHVIEALVDEGQIRLNIENQLEVEATVTVTLPNFELQPGISFTQSQVIPALSRNTSSIELNDLTMINFKSPGSVIDSLHFEITVVTTPSLGLTHISNSDSVIVRFDADSIFFRRFEGEIDTVEVAIDTVKQEDIFNYNDFEGSVRLDDLQLELTIFNEIGIPVEMLIDIRGEHRNSDTGQLETFLDLDPIPIQVMPGTSGIPSTNLVTLNGSNSRIVELMQILPTDIVMSGTATIMGTGIVTITDSVWGEYEISSPFNVFVDSIPDFESDIDILDEIDDDIKNTIENRFQNANLELNFENGLPLSADVIIIFATDTTDFFEIDTSDTNKLIIDDLEIKSGTIGTDGYVSIPFEGQISSILSEKEVKIFSSDTLYFGSKIIFPDVNTAMKFRSTDAFIGIGSMKFKVFMNPEDE
jgi:hypothetical protein